MRTACAVLLAAGLALPVRGFGMQASRLPPRATLTTTSRTKSIEVVRGPRDASTTKQVQRASLLSDGDDTSVPGYPRSKYNAPIIGGLLAAAVTALLFRDVLAILALYQYDSMMEADWLPESLKLLARLPADLLADYGAAANARPVVVKACTSGVAYLVGDVVAQAYEGRREIAVLDLQRAARNSISGFLLHGPILHYWIEFLEGPVTLAFCAAVGITEIVPKTPAEFSLIFSKIFLDQTIFALGFNTIYSIALSVLAARKAEEIVNNVKETLVPSLFSSWRFWPLVHLVSYSPLVPVELKLLWIDVCEIFWVAILSFIANDEKKTVGSEPTVSVIKEFDVQPAIEIVLASRVELLCTLNQTVNDVLRRSS
ncbi:hypothetical protein CTAYLR_001300 [Chrysophaeum taylorii]|uniref:Protein Mpv17 n=1 Tax=Chrysophaeum taylorii TaxID=2483200 RepID=A0AAD7XLF7_9STRA|nr:hypothetical protein CTAYLR_001300 [Chrysophaeum taylorii]